MNTKTKISLCMITGNEAAVIVRLLNSASAAFDELCLVRAIGDRPHDDTIALAYEWCVKHGKTFHPGEYLNKVPGLQHVDDFGAARNMSFELATGDYQLWLDCDDLLTPEACASIRECAEENNADAYVFGYAKPGGSSCPRERLIRRGAGRWINRIHETCKVESGDLCLESKVVIYHAPVEGHAKDSHPRNMRLLQLTLEHADRNLFYLHEEWFLRAVRPDLAAPEPGARAQAIATANAALALSMKAEEIYEICLNMCELEPDKFEYWIFKALALQPWRREALSYLTQNALAKGNLNHAVSWFRMMDNLPRPEPLPWTHRDIWHGWGRHYLRVKILRARGQTEQAEKEHAEHMKDPVYANAVNGGHVERNIQERRADIAA